MTNDPNSLKKVAVLTGLTVLIGGAEISGADAASYSVTDQFNFQAPANGANSTSESFAGFNTSLGSLSGVTFGLASHIFSDSGENVPITATVSLETSPTSTQISSASGATYPTAFSYAFSNVDGTHGGAIPLSFFDSSFSAALALSPNCVECTGHVIWSAIGGAEGLTVTYTYTPVSATPLPATLPLLASGLAGLGFTTWRSRRKRAAKEKV